jgi:hypothetical protein
MTQQEYDAWMQETKRSEGKWMLDEIQLYNHKRYLFYKGGTNGQYVEITKEGLLTVGIYEGAIPHIGEAFFKRKAKKQYTNQSEALKAAIELGGMDFLIDLCSVY